MAPEDELLIVPAPILPVGESRVVPKDTLTLFVNCRSDWLVVEMVPFASREMTVAPDADLEVPPVVLMRREGALEGTSVYDPVRWLWSDGRRGFERFDCDDNAGGGAEE